MTIELWKILIGIITAILLIILKEAHTKAHKQKIIINKIESYLSYWQKMIIENDFFGIYNQGIEWNKAEIDLISKDKGAEALVELENAIKEALQGRKDNIKKGLPKLEATIREKIPEKTLPLIYQDLTDGVKNLVEGKSFISDEEASCLDLYISKTAISLKLELISLINLLKVLVIITVNSPSNKLENDIDQISKGILKVILISKHMDSLSMQLKTLRNESIVKLTIKNIFN